MKNKLCIPKNKEQIKTINEHGFNSFILPIKNISVGFETFFTLEEAKNISENNDVYLIINKLFHYDEIDKTIELLSSISYVKGFIIEDLGLINRLKDKNVILFQNHLNMNYEAINYYNDLGIKSVVLTNELTINEIEEIKNKVNSDLYYFMISKNNIMYSRRKLITNYLDYFNLENNKEYYEIRESVSKYKLLVCETEDGTVFINDKIFSGYGKLTELKNLINYFIYNFSYIDEKECNIILKNIDSLNLNEQIEFDDYFLNNEINYKVKE